VAAAIARPTPAVARLTPVERDGTVALRVEFSERESGRVSYWNDNTFNGTIEVPRSVIDRGQDATYDWIREHIRDYGLTDSGDIVYDDYETTDREENDLNTNFDEVVDQLEEEEEEEEEEANA
jgi:hypothetical protein